MTKRRAILILVTAVLAGTALLYFILGGKTPSGNPIDVFTGSPFGTPPTDNGSSSSDGSINTGSNSGGGNSATFAKLFKLSDVPVAGATSFISNGSLDVRYVSRADGHVFDVNPSTLAKVEVLNITSPKIYVAEWKADGSGFVERSLVGSGETVSNVAVTIIPPKATSTAYTSLVAPIRGFVDDIKVLADGSVIYNLSDTGAVVNSGFQGEKPRTLFTLDFTDWQMKPVNASAVLLLTKPSASAEGYAYLLNPKTGSFSRLLGPLDGLSALLSPDGKRLVYNSTSGSANSTFVLNLSTSLTTSIYPPTLPDKCAWSKKLPSTVICGAPRDGLGKDVPDEWYQGLASYSDRIYRFNSDTNTAELLADPEKDFNTKLDVMSPFLSPDEDYLFFTDKNSLLLWALKL